MSLRQSQAKGDIASADGKDAHDVSSYPVDVSSFLLLPHCTFDPMGVPYHGSPTGYHPTTIAQYALAHWNAYLITAAENHGIAFLTQAHWLVEHEERIGDGASGWPIHAPDPNYNTTGPYLSALTQGNSISVLVRAYQLTREGVFLEVARRAVRTFERDILDGGVSVPIGVDGIFFEETGVYPAAHVLSGLIFALFGLYDYVALTGETKIEKLIERSLATMHRLLDEFDVGYWTRADLLHLHLASPSHLASQAALLEALSRYSHCDHCSMLASRWRSYQRRIAPRLRYLIASRWSNYSHALLDPVRMALFPKSQHARVLRVCVPVTAFPVTGGIRAVLAKTAQVMTDKWQLEYLTQHVGPDPEAFVIHRFGTGIMSPWQFPGVWLYFLAGCRKLISLLFRGAGYNVILPQDGVFTAAFTALAAKLAGVRVVCIDHGNLTLLKNRAYRTERIQALATKSQPRRFLEHLLFVAYWPSLILLASIAARLVDHFLIPGIEGDGVEEVGKWLGVPASRITRFASMVDVDHHVFLDATSKANMREKNGIAADAIVIAIICRFAPEKGVDIALESLSRILAVLSPELCARTRIIIVGSGPLYKQVEKDIDDRGLRETCLLWGEASAKDVISLLALSDIFLYTSRRGACFSMAVLEAMASGCAVVASTEPLANAHLLSQGRGIAVPPDNAEQTTMALLRLVNDLELCRRMGDMARDYIGVRHSPAMFRRTLMRVTYWSALNEILDCGKKSEPVASGRE